VLAAGRACSRDPCCAAPRVAHSALHPVDAQNYNEAIHREGQCQTALTHLAHRHPPCPPATLDSLQQLLGDVASRLDGIQSQVTHLASEQDAFVHRMGTMEKQMGDIEAKIGHVDEGIADLDARMDRLNERMGTIEDRIDKVDERLESFDRWRRKTAADLTHVQTRLDNMALRNVWIVEMKRERGAGPCLQTKFPD
jgi:uncharacterized protein YoxC